MLLVLISSVVYSDDIDVQAVIKPNQNGVKGRAANQEPETNNIAFDLPDVIVNWETPNGETEIEAFKSTNNDKILREAGTPRSSQLVWVSLGHPTFVAIPGSDSRLFHESANGHYTYIRMLTTGQRKLLAARATRKYMVNVSYKQILNVVLSKFDCRIDLYDETDKKLSVLGRVTDLRGFPLRMDISTPEHSPERKLLSSELSASTIDLSLSCVMETAGKDVNKFHRELSMYALGTETPTQLIEQLRSSLAQIRAEMGK